jgi:hypothetical protein
VVDDHMLIHLVDEKKVRNQSPLTKSPPGPEIGIGIVIVIVIVIGMDRDRDRDRDKDRNGDRESVAPLHVMNFILKLAMKSRTAIRLIATVKTIRRRSFHKKRRVQLVSWTLIAPVLGEMITNHTNRWHWAHCSFEK